MNFAATTSLRSRAGARPATNSILRRLPALVTSASLTAMMLVTTVTPVAATTSPTSVQAQALSDTKVLVLWTPVTGATSYDVYRNPGAVHVGTTVPRTRFEDNTVAAATTYSYAVTANPSPAAPSYTATVTTQTGPPDATSPAFSAGTLTPSAITSSSVNLSWPHATDNVGVVGYRIFRGEDAATPVDIITTDVTLSYTATNLKAGTNYTFEVQAIDAADKFSTKLSTPVTTLTATDSPPPTPASGTIFVTPFSDTRLDITWGTVAGAVGYRIFRGATLVGEVDEPASPWFSETGLTASTSYTYTIVAFSSGLSAAAPSSPKTGTTLANSVVKVVRGPYVQWVTQTSARIAWWTNIPSKSQVNYGTVTPSVTVTDATPGTGGAAGQDQEHVVLLDALAPATAYVYTVGDGSAVSSQATFKTSVAAGTSFSFDAIGDYGAASVGQTNNAGRIAVDGAQFLQTLGDNVYSEAEDPNFTLQYSEFDGHFFKPMKPALSAKALWTANGNKEYYGHGAWFEMIWAPNNEKWYSYDWGDAHIVVLDSSQPFNPSSAQYTWAQADLAANQGSAWRIVVIQDPPYSSTSANSSSGAVEASLVPLFEAQGVQLVLSGNSHNYERSKPLIGGVPATGGITYMVSGNGGNAFNPFILAQPSWSAFRQDSQYGYLNISVSPTALVVNEISAASGATIDTTTINAPLPSGGSTYVPLTPARLLDTRVGNGLSGKFTANTPRTFQVTGRGGVPANATGVTGNFTVTNQTAAGAAFLGPNSTASPATSTLNFPLGDTRANGVTLALGAGGTLSATYLYSPGATTDFIFDVTGYFVPDGSGSTYVPLTPDRLLDTRVGNGLSGKFSANTPRTFQVTGRGGVPLNATGVTGNFTVTNQTAAGAAFLGPNSTASPATSTLNFPLADTRANGVTLSLGTGGTLSATYLYTPGATTDFIFDVTGYFVPDSSGATYVPLTPARLLDTRVGNGLFGKFSANTPRTFQVTGRGGVPATATGVTGNFTVTNQTAAGAAFLGPNSTATPATSTLNFPLGDTRANGETLSLGTGGTLSATYLYTPGATTDFIWDVTGYFAP